MLFKFIFCNFLCWQIQVVAMATKIVGGVSDEAPAKPTLSSLSTTQEQKPLVAEKSESTEHLFFPMESSEDGVAEKKTLKNTLGSVQSVYSKEEVRAGVSKESWSLSNIIHVLLTLSLSLLSLCPSFALSSSPFLPSPLSLSLLLYFFLPPAFFAFSSLHFFSSCSPSFFQSSLSPWLPCHIFQLRIVPPILASLISFSSRKALLLRRFDQLCV